MWGHKVNSCMTVPKIALATDYISKYKDKTATLIKEYMRVNDRNTKRSTIRLLQSTGAFDDTIDPSDYLSEQDFCIEMDDVDFEEQ